MTDELQQKRGEKMAEEADEKAIVGRFAILIEQRRRADQTIGLLVDRFLEDHEFSARILVDCLQRAAEKLEEQL